MSGICGIVHWNDPRPEEDGVRPMLDAAPYRGPDGRFRRTEGRASFGYLSLEVTPESRGEGQPLVHTPTGVMATADLRLDNRDDLVRRLGKNSVERCRAEISSPAPSVGGPATDAEILVAAFLRWGAECCSHLLGDFAFAIWDPRDERLLLARDPMGMRALYYRIEPGRTLFATEVKQILAIPGVDRRINEAAVAAHLTGSNHALAASFYAGIDQVAAGAALRISHSATEEHRFWEIDPEAHIRYRDERDYVEHFRVLFCEAVACRMRTDRPVGISMSGGMDSGSIAAAVGWLKENGKIPADTDFRSYNWAFSELAQCDERTNSKKITDRYRIPAVPIPADEAWTLADYPEHGPDADEPFFGFYQCLIERTVAAAHRDGARLLISGDRGDLLVGCAVTDMTDLLVRGKLAALYKELRFRARPSKMPAAALRYLLKPLASDMAHGLAGKFSRADPLKRLRDRRVSATPRYPDYLNERFLRENDILENIYQPAERLPRHAVRRRYLHLFTPLHMKGMVWSERTNTRLGVGFADPFSDRRLAEYVLAIPQSVVSRLSDQKRILRAAMRDIMPPEAIRGAVKVSPQPLCLKGLREKARPLVLELVTDSVAARYGYVHDAGVGKQVEAFLDGANNLAHIWPILTLEMWLRLHWE